MRKVANWLVLSVVLTLAALPGCRGASAANVSLGQEFSLAIGQSAAIESEGLTLKFVRVVGDSRCPEGVECFWQGEVSCEVSVTYSGSSYQMVLTQPGLTSEPASKTFQQFRFTFSVDPYPQKGKKIDSSDYRLNLTVEKIEPETG